MKFTEFKEYIPKILKQQLPSVSAHLLMAPAERKTSMASDYYLSNNPKPSAVMMLFYPKNENVHLVLTKRNEYPGVHSAQISFPGGKAEKNDKDLSETALRETYEEIGVRAGQINIIMPFSKIYIPPSNFLVSPFMGVANSEIVFKPDPGEVKEIIELPLEVLLDESVVTQVEMKTSYANKIAVPAFRFNEHIVWGATAMILSELKETIKKVIKS
jgi:8-oxo-dGTP pyrophosphatase MutT (NUDIX family)